MKMFMEIHKGLKTFSNFHLVRKFNKSIYGLKQIFTAWYQRLYYYLIFHALTRIDSYANIYFKCEVNGRFIIFKMYIDDHVVFNNQLLFIHLIKFILFHEFEMFGRWITLYYWQCHHKKPQRRLDKFASN
jgi:hypothetical protein